MSDYRNLSNTSHHIKVLCLWKTTVNWSAHAVGPKIAAIPQCIHHIRFTKFLGNKLRNVYNLLKMEGRMWYTQNRSNSEVAWLALSKKIWKMGLPKEAYVYYSSPTAGFTMGFFGELACGLKPVPWMMEPQHIFKSWCHPRLGRYVKDSFGNDMN